jgi:hypothetical protein
MIPVELIQDGFYLGGLGYPNPSISKITNVVLGRTPVSTLNTEEFVTVSQSNLTLESRFKKKIIFFVGAKLNIFIPRSIDTPSLFTVSINKEDSLYVYGIKNNVYYKNVKDSDKEELDFISIYIDNTGLVTLVKGAVVDYNLAINSASQGSDWILVGGAWNDSGVWDDNQTWSDT